MTSTNTLRQFPVFQAVPDDQLQWFLDRADEHQVPEQTTLYKPNEPVDHLGIVVEGAIRLDSDAQGTKEEIALLGPGAITGVLPYSRMTHSITYWNVHEPTVWLTLHRDHLRPMTQECYELTEAFVHIMTSRVRHFTKQAQQNEKMASLGRLSAGLAHELNNPVAAVVRSAHSLKDHMRATPEGFKIIMKLQLSDEQVDSVNKALFRRLDEPTKPLSMLEKSSLEDELTDWLDDQNISDSLDLAGSLVEFGFTTDDLDLVLEQVGEANLTGVLNWLVNTLVTEKLVKDIANASQRIQTLVSSIKNYTYMDRGEGKTTLHLGEGIQSTLTLLNHKLRHKNIAITTKIPGDLPDICGWPGELNQVWTNLIDNAIDALPQGGELTITSEKDRDFILTKVIDNGSGIPDDIITKIFDPFFTTKPIGSGTGLGLDIVQGIIQRHNGSIKVQSKPGQTEFSVCLPIS